jgi:hypothetical protein
MDATRRHVLGLVPLGVSLLSGCVFFHGHLPDITVRNVSQTAKTFQIGVVRDSDGEVLLDDSLSLAAESTTEYPHLVRDESVEIHVDVEDGPTETYEFFDSDSDAYGASIRIHAHSLEYSRSVA